MSMLSTFRCKLGWHSWEPIVGDVAGAFHKCLYCGKAKKVDTGNPPNTRDKSQFHN